MHENPVCLLPFRPSHEEHVKMFFIPGSTKCSVLISAVLKCLDSASSPRAMLEGGNVRRPWKESPCCSLCSLASSGDVICTHIDKRAFQMR